MNNKKQNVPSKNGQAQEKIRPFEKIWGKDVAKFGFTQVPNLLIYNPKRLGLIYSDFYFICLILSKANWKSKYPFFSLNKITRDIKICAQTLRNIIVRLLGNDFLKTYPRKENPQGKGRNDYDISGLINGLQVLAAIKLEDSEKGGARKTSPEIPPHNVNSMNELMKTRNLNYRDDTKSDA